LLLQGALPTRLARVSQILMSLLYLSLSFLENQKYLPGIQKLDIFV